MTPLCKLFIISSLFLLSIDNIKSGKPIRTENGWFIPGRGCGVSTTIKYRNYLPQDIDNEKHECTFVAIPSGDNTAVCEFEEIDVDSSSYYTYHNIPDAQTCHGLCLKHQYCKFFLWISPEFGNLQKYECWLKWGHISDEIIKSNVASHYRLCKPPVCKFKQFDLDSANYFLHVNIPDANTCHSLCLKHEHCEFFTWVSPQFYNKAQANQCYLKWGSLTETSQKSNVYANYRSC